MNKIKTLITLLTVGILGGFSLSAQTADKTRSLTDVDVSGQIGYESTYVFRGQEVVDDVATLSVAVEYNKVYLAVDAFSEISGDDFGLEVDVTGGIIVEDILFNGTFVDAGVIGYFYDTNASVDTTELFVGVGADLYVFDVNGYVYYDVDREALTVIGSLTNTLQLTDDAPLFGKVFLVTKGQIGFVEDKAGLPSVVDDFKYGFASVSSDIVVFVKDARISVGGRYNFSDDSDVNDINDFSWGASLGYSF